MKTFLLLSVLTIFSLFTFSNNVHSEDNYDYFGDSIDGIFDVQQSILSDMYNPMTHFNKGDFSIIFNPVYYKVNRVLVVGGTDHQLDGEDLSGMALALIINYALTNDWFLYNFLSRTNMNGKIIYAGQVEDQYIFDGSSNLYTYHLGLGYDILSDRRKWSMPLLFGISYSYYNINMSLSPSSENVNTDYWDITGNGNIFGMFIGITTSRKIEIFSQIFKISPYFIYGRYFNKPIVNGTVTSLNTNNITPSVPVGYSTEISGCTRQFFMPGISFLYDFQSSFSISFSLSGIAFKQYDFFNEVLYDGLQLVSYSISFSYNFKNNEE